jgi:hypothetical protein
MNGVDAITASNGQKLTPDQQAQLAKLIARDRQVRAHEASHLAAAGSLARGGARFSYERGPDGKMYAVGGEVDIDTSPGRTPEETLSKARRIKAAAGAPGDPSPADNSVASNAVAMEANAMEVMLAKAANVASGSRYGSNSHRTMESQVPKILNATA